MLWPVCLVLSAAVLLLSIIYAAVQVNDYRSGRWMTPLKALLFGIFLALFIALIPIVSASLEHEAAYVVKLIIYDILQAVQVFIGEAGGDFILENVNRTATSISGIYSTYLSVLFIMAQVLTISVVISLFINLLAEIKYRLRYWGDVYAFSDLNEKAVALARSVRRNHKRAVIVFGNVNKGDEDDESVYGESAKQLKAVMFKKDLVSINLGRHRKKDSLTFIMTGENERENLLRSLKLLEDYKHREHTNLYVCSTSAEGELLLANADRGEVKVRRINEERALIYQFLYNDGESLFETAAETPDGEHQITAVIVGLGKYGMELLKALTWYCQMDGYSLVIHAIDADEQAEEKFAARCPELASESDYTIKIHAGIDVETQPFAEVLRAIPDMTYLFVCLGDEDDNINQSANIRTLCERMGSRPVIKTIVYNIDEKKALEGITNYRNQPYGIETLGDFETLYSEEILLGSELEKLGLERHLKWGKEEEFWQYEYNYRSSVASAIHMKARKACGIPGADKREEDLSDSERTGLERLEHRRWCAYMRSEGYVYSGSRDKASRNDLAKVHPDLVDYELLSEEDRRKDSKIGAL